jgi:shikimate dehydrogenase
MRSGEFYSLDCPQASWKAESLDLLVNASPMGMRPDDPLPIDVSRLPASTFVGDVVTKPPLTPFTKTGRTSPPI